MRVRYRDVGCSYSLSVYSYGQAGRQQGRHCGYAVTARSKTCVEWRVVREKEAAEDYSAVELSREQR